MPMSGATTLYEIFISYARKDNLPIPPSHPHGWVTALRDHIVADHRRFSTEPLPIFFDTEEIKDMDDWRLRILGALRNSKILLICLSPNYIASQTCRWEWDEYIKRQVHQLMGSDSIAAVYFVEVPGSSEQVNAKWLDLVQRGNFTDIRPWYQEGAKALQLAEVRKRMAKLGESLWERIQRARRAEAAPGNLRRQTPFFVGRKQELLELHNRLGVGAIGVVTAVHGLGGQGKTELAVAYAHAFADCYPAGLWGLRAEGKGELLPLIGELAFDPALGYAPTDAEKNDPALLGKAVLRHLKSLVDAVRALDPDKEAAAMLLLDNVSEPGLLAPGQLASLPRANWLRLVATTRLGPDQLRANPKALALLEVDSLSETDALELVREHQPARDSQGNILADPTQGIPGFVNSAEAEAARDLVRELGGFTLAVEQVAVFLGLHPEIAPSAFLAGLRQKGLPSADALPVKHADVAEQMHHQHKQLALILQATLAKLNEPALTALHFAALLPPETIPWPWLRELTLARHPQLAQRDADEPDPWLDIRRRLTGLRLLTSGDHPEVARIHRLVAAHLRQGLEATMRDKLAKHAGSRSDAINWSQQPPDEWELDALIILLPHLLADEPTRDLANDAMFLVEKIVTYRSLPAAQALLQTAHVVISRLAASDPANADWQRDLSISFEKLGDLAVAQGDLPAAARQFSAALEISERLAASDPANAAWQRHLSISFNKLGDLAVAQGNLPAAERHFSAGLKIGERLAASDPANSEWQRGLSISFERLGKLAVSQGDLPAATPHLTACLKIRERLAASDPANSAWQRDLSVSYLLAGQLLMRQERSQDALSMLEKSLEIAERLAGLDLSNAIWQNDARVSRQLVADLRSRLGLPP
jgi:tetratricopeptide (TPR) repeat protein